MKSLATVEYLCASHPHKPAAGCAGCVALASFESEAKALRARRGKLLTDIKVALKNKLLIIADVQ